MNNGFQSAIELGPIKSASRLNAALISVWLLAGAGLPGANAVAQPPAGKKPQTVTVNCPGKSIQTSLDQGNLGRLRTLNINGICTEDVLVTLDNVTFNGSPGATISGTITVDGARWVVFQNLTVTGTGNGIVATRNATVTVRNSFINQNDDNGIIVKDGAQAEILNGQIDQNGQNPSDPDQGLGISVTDGGIARIIENSINDNLSFGVDSSNGGQIQLESNSIMRNGRLALFESGAIVSRARIRADGNVYQDNAYAAIDVFNEGSYRTGRGLSSAGVLDNPLGFETYSVGTLGQIAVSVGRGSYADLRQIIVNGAIEIGSDSLLHVRGDNVGPSIQCSVVGDITAYGVNSTIQLAKFTRVDGLITADPNQGNRVEDDGTVGLVCPPPPPA